MVKRHHYPLAAHKLLSLSTVFFLFAAFVLLLLVGLSLPIIKPIYILAVRAVTTGPATSTGTELRFGVWGVCVTSALDQPTLLTNNGQCTPQRLGYDIPPFLFQLLGVPTSVGSIILTGLLVILVLHPIAAGLSFLTLLFSLFLASHGLAIVALILSIVTAIVTSVVLAIDVALVVIAQQKTGDLGVGFHVDFGPAVWLVVTSVALTWIAVVCLSARACYCCGVRRRAADSNHEYAKDSTHQPNGLSPANNEMQMHSRAASNTVISNHTQ